MKAPRKTIAQMRRDEVMRLARYREDEPSDETIREAERLMNSFYRLAALDDRNLYLSNDERTCNSRYTKAQEDKAYRWYQRLSKELDAFCGFTLTYFGHLPTITDKTYNRKVSAHYYR